jgi:1,4-alpha-glucan branching enzyme
MGEPVYGIFLGGRGGGKVEMSQGALALILHAHLPYVRHPEREDALEERWLFEAIAESYIPLLAMFQRLVEERVAFQVTLSLSPTLLSMLSDPLLQKRTLQYLDRLVELAEKEMVRTHNLPDFYPLAKVYKERFQEVRDFYLRYRGDLIQAFRELRDSGHIELITTAATHAFLPLVLTEESVRAQVLTGIREFERHFGERPRGRFPWCATCSSLSGFRELFPSGFANGSSCFFQGHGLFRAGMEFQDGLPGRCGLPGVLSRYRF